LVSATTLRQTAHCCGGRRAWWPIENDKGCPRMSVCRAMLEDVGTARPARPNPLACTHVPIGDGTLAPGSSPCSQRAISGIELNHQNTSSLDSRRGIRIPWLSLRRPPGRRLRPHNLRALTLSSLVRPTSGCVSRQPRMWCKLARQTAAFAEPRSTSNVSASAAQLVRLRPDHALLTRPTCEWAGAAAERVRRQVAQARWGIH
jgi:hypothetical protein